MNYILFFLCCSLGILILSIIVACISPIINNFRPSNNNNFSFSSWRTLTCEYFSDQAKSDTAKVDDIQKYTRYKNLCYKKKAMHDLEYAFLIFDIVLGFACANLSLLHYFNVGKDFEKKTGLIGLIIGIVCFILTLVYICYNGDIFNNDIAYSYFTNAGNYAGGITKLYPNGATTKGGLRVYSGEKDIYSQYIKYKDLGKKQYNYDKEFYKIYESSNSCKTLGCSCDYCFTRLYSSYENKDLYDRWLTTLILAIIIDICCIGLSVFGFLLFKSSKGDSSGEKTVPIN